jgi:hypothetical protein
MKSLKDINKTGHSCLIISLIGLLFTISLASPSIAQVNRTPDSKSILVISPATFHQGRHFDWMVGRCVSQQYSIADSAIYSQDSLPRLNPTVTCSTYIKAMTEGDWGVFIFQSHGSASGIAAEFYEDTDSGEIARDAAYQSYLDAGIPESFIYKGHTDSAGFSIGITPAGIRHFQNQVSGTIVFALACHSAGLNDDWGALVALGYNDVITLPAGADTFFQRLNGQEGIEKPDNEFRIINNIILACGFIESYYIVYCIEFGWSASSGSVRRRPDGDGRCFFAVAFYPTFNYSNF